jgi:tRNA G18 (ribose-2'-O)-methylase SpoU
MFQVHRIGSLDLPELEPYRTLKRPLDHVARGIFVAESVKVVRRLLESDFGVVSVLLPEKWLPEFAPLLEARPEHIPVYVVAHKRLLEQLVGFSMFQGVMAVGRIPAPVRLEDVLARSPQPRLFVAAEQLANAENIGGLVRNAAAFGAQALIAGETCASPFLRRAVRNSMGTVFRLPVVEPPSLLAALWQLRDAGVRCVAAHPHAQGRTLARADFTGDVCLVFGSEGEGLSARVLAACDEAVAIPMAPGVDSLNVVNAAAVFLYEVNRQRGRA